MHKMAKETTEHIPEWLKAMPKTDLHCHLGGSMRIETILELADKHGITLPSADEDELKKSIVFKDRAVKSLASYLDCIKTCESVLVSPDAFRKAAYEVCEDAHNENVKVFELRFGPTNYRRENLKLYEIVEATLDGIKTAARDFSMQTGLIICGIRTDMDATRLAAEIAINYQDAGVVGFDLAGKENGHPPSDFKEILLPVLMNFMPVTIHAGEDGGVRYVAEALAFLNAQRIGHGVSIRESPRVMEYMNETRKGIEICLTSNIDTGSVASFETHPIRPYLQKDLRISINTDNRTISDTDVTHEYMTLMRELSFSQQEVYLIAQRGIKSAFLDNREKQRLLTGFDSFVEKYPVQK
jgi:adenosine deaminase